MRPEPERAAVGFTVKSGWACAVLLAGPHQSPRAVDAARVELSDPAVPASRQPYHEGFGTARAGGPALQRLLRSVRTFGRRSVAERLRSYRAAGYDVCGVGLVVGSLVDPETIANDHIRIHALEGRLFRTVVHDAATRRRLPCAVWRERDLVECASAALGRTEAMLRQAVTVLGRDRRGGWRAEHKGAALAAWLVLAGHVAPVTTPAARRARPATTR